MAEPAKTPDTPKSEQKSYPVAMDDPLPSGNDPGGAHQKGYTAQPGPERPIPEDGPVPLASDADVEAHVQKPDQSDAVPRSGPGTYGPNNRLTGADR